jgi:hypothetical protein
VVHEFEEEILRPEDLSPRVCTSPDGQPVVAMMPEECSAISSASIRDHLPSWPSNDAIDDNLNRLRSPVAFSATMVMCV